MTPADDLWTSAHDAGVRVCFANPGTTEMWLVDGLNRSAVRAVLCLHETVCTGAADGYARLYRSPATTLLHLAPGLANGLANLHNARRASTPVVNLVGCMASWHEAADPLLNMDMSALATAVSTSVTVTSSAANLASEISLACAVTANSQPAGGSRISTVIIPHDHTWKQDSSGQFAYLATLSAALKTLFQADACPGLSLPQLHTITIGNASLYVLNNRALQLLPAHQPMRCALAVSSVTPAALQAKPAETITTNQPCNPQPCNPEPAAVHFLVSCAKALKACPGGQSAIYCGGQALLEDHGSLVYLGKVAAATGATLICENAFPRADRGAGLPHFQVCDCHLAAFAGVLFECISRTFTVVKMHALERP